MRKVLYITGSRADYSPIYSTLKAINDNAKLNLCLLVTGMHLSKKFGYTIQEIRKHGFQISAVVDSPIKKMDNCEMAKSLGYCLLGMVENFKKIKPDIVLLVGDRGEALAGAIASAFMNIPIVHIAGGDISGSIDNSIRKAITQFAHIHLANTPKSAEKLLKMGEQAWRIKMIGFPGLDKTFKELILRKKLCSILGLDDKKPIILVVQHPVTGESQFSGEQMNKTLKAIVKLKQQTVLIYPNADAGSKEIIKVIEQYKKHSFIKIFKTLSQKSFFSLMAEADLMIGNSSAALVEAPLFNLPIINIGARQKGRERAKNVIDAEYNTQEIYNKACQVLANKEKNKFKKIKSPYKNINTENKIVNILLKLKINHKLLDKYGF